MQSQIPCPDCGTPILFDTKLLIAGSQFQCPNCPVSISLSSTSTSTVSNAMAEFEQVAEQHRQVGEAGQRSLQNL